MTRLPLQQCFVPAPCRLQEFPTLILNPSLVQQQRVEVNQIVVGFSIGDHVGAFDPTVSNFWLAILQENSSEANATLQVG